MPKCHFWCCLWMTLWEFTGPHLLWVQIVILSTERWPLMGPLIMSLSVLNMGSLSPGIFLCRAVFAFLAACQADGAISSYFQSLEGHMLYPPDDPSWSSFCIVNLMWLGQGAVPHPSSVCVCCISTYLRGHSGDTTTQPTLLKNLVLPDSLMGGRQKISQPCPSGGPSFQIWAGWHLLCGSGPLVVLSTTALIFMLAPGLHHFPTGLSSFLNRELLLATYP
jgi:hypothetical protein